jgi:hypothetical protein
MSSLGPSASRPSASGHAAPGRWAQWVAWWDRREDPLPLALVRIGIAVVLLYDLAACASHGLVPVLWSPPELGGLAYGVDATWWPAWFRSDPSAPAILAGATALAALSLGVGFFTRLSAVVLVLLYAQLATLLPEADRGIDNLFRCVLLLLAMSGAGATLSLDAKWKTGRFAPANVTIPAWPRYLVIAQLVWMYFSAATHKLQGPWTPMGGFTALYYILQDPHFAAYDFAWIRSVVPLTRIATFFTMAFEWGAPLVLVAYWYEGTPDRPGRLRRWFNRVRFRHVWIGVGVVFHLTLFATMRLGIFPLGTLVIYPAFFAAPELRSIVARRRTRKRAFTN